MASLIDAMTLREPPSRNALSEEEEGVAAELRAARGGARPELRLATPAPAQADLVLVALGAPLCEAALACFAPATLHALGRGSGAGGVVCELKMARAGAFCVVLVLFSGAQPVPEEDACEWAEALLAALPGGGGHAARELVVLDGLSAARFQLEGRRARPPLVRCVAADAPALAHCRSLGLVPLETGNLVTGLAAALLTEARLCARRPARALALLPLREAHLEKEALLAIVPPLVGLLAAAAREVAGGAAALLPAPDVSAGVAKIRERRAIDRELMYV